MFKTTFVLTLTVLGLAACAKSPSSIAPVAVSSADYEGLSCEQLSQELALAEEKLKTASEAQNRAQTSDALGVFLVMVPVSAMVGDAEGDVAYHKGEAIAIQRQMKRSGC